MQQLIGSGRIHTSEADPELSDEDDIPFQSEANLNMVSEMYVSSTASKDGGKSYEQE